MSGQIIGGVNNIGAATFRRPLGQHASDRVSGLWGDDSIPRTAIATLNGASSVATLYADPSTATANPAVTLRSVGASGGQAAAFTFDLARSVVLTRQGNPAWVNQDRDGNAPVRSDDLFFGAKAGDVQPDWVNLNKVAIPQADEQQRCWQHDPLDEPDRKHCRGFGIPNGHPAVW
jgi:hypothetical protein